MNLQYFHTKPIKWAAGTKTQYVKSAISKSVRIEAPYALVYQNLGPLNVTYFAIIANKVNSLSRVNGRTAEKALFDPHFSRCEI